METTTSFFDLENMTNFTNVTDIWNTTENTTTKSGSSGSGLPPMGYYGYLRKSFWIYVPPFIMSIGTIGNILTIIVLLRQAKSLSSTALFLMALAVSDTMILWCGPLRNWLSSVWELDVRYLSEASCKMQIYITYVSIHVSSWMLVAVTMERTISVTLPHKVKLGFTTRNAGIIIVCTVAVICGIDAIVPVMVTLENPFRKKAKCAPKTEDLQNFRDYYWGWIDFAVAFALPFIFLVTGNIIIVVKLAQSRVNKKKMKVTRGGKGGGGNRETSVSVLLIFLSVMFFFTIAPTTVFAIYYPYRYEELLKMKFVDGYYGYESLMFGHAVVNLLGYSNAAFNFILYVFSGQKFRGELINLFLCRPPGKTSAFGEKTTSKSSSKQTRTTDVRTYPTAYPATSSFNQSTENQSNVDTVPAVHVNVSENNGTLPVVTETGSSPLCVEDVKPEVANGPET